MKHELQHELQQVLRQESLYGKALRLMHDKKPLETGVSKNLNHFKPKTNVVR